MRMRFYERVDCLELDAVSVRNLELVEPLFSGEVGADDAVPYAGCLLYADGQTAAAGYAAAARASRPVGDRSAAGRGGRGGCRSAPPRGRAAGDGRRARPGAAAGAGGAGFGGTARGHGAGRDAGLPARVRTRWRFEAKRWNELAGRYRFSTDFHRRVPSRNSQLIAQAYPQPDSIRWRICTSSLRARIVGGAAGDAGRWRSHPRRGGCGTGRAAELGRVGTAGAGRD